MPRVHASNTEKFALHGKIEKNMEIDVGYRMRQCNTADIPHHLTSFNWRLGV